MVFKAMPNLYVKVSNKYIQRLTGLKGFYFDKDGLYETDKKILIQALTGKFEEVKEEKVYKCKKCDFETTNKGKLMAHYRTHKESE